MVSETEVCMKCKRGYPEVYQVGNRLWKKITGISNGSGTYCMKCLAKMADKKGITIYWTGTPDRW